MNPTVNWVVKASKLCNMRCGYCYEWNELHLRDRMSLEVWKQLLRSAGEYHVRQHKRLGRKVTTRIIWHGGEPTLLPLSYFEAVLELQGQLFAEEGLSPADFQNILQTNLLTISDEKLEFFAANRIHLGVSFDVMSGTRLDVGGRETERRVVENMDRLREHGIGFGAITVLAGHTARNIVAIYNFYESLGIDFRVLPLFDAPLNTADAPFALKPAHAIRALGRLFRHWIRRPERVIVHPLVEYTYAVYHKLIHRTQPRYDRPVSEWAIVANTDGTLYQVMDAYDPLLAHGNVMDRSFLAMTETEPYRNSLERDERLFQEHCAPCRFVGACTSLPLFEAKRTDEHASRCSIGFGVMEQIEKYFTLHKVSPDQVLQFLA